MSEIIDLLEKAIDRMCGDCASDDCSTQRGCPYKELFDEIDQALATLKQPKCSTCGDTKKVEYELDDIQGDVMIPCPDCQQPKDIQLKHIKIWICQMCLDGKGEECHTPGCALYLHAVDLPIDSRLYEIDQQPKDQPSSEFTKEPQKKLGYETRTIENTYICSCGNIFVEADDYDTIGSESGVCCPNCGNEKFQTIKARLDTSEASRKELLEACKCAKMSIDMQLVCGKGEDPETERAMIIALLEAAIANAKKAGG